MNNIDRIKNIIIELNGLSESELRKHKEFKSFRLLEGCELTFELDIYGLSILCTNEYSINITENAIYDYINKKEYFIYELFDKCDDCKEYV